MFGYYIVAKYNFSCVMYVKVIQRWRITGERGGERYHILLRDYECSTPLETLMNKTGTFIYKMESSHSISLSCSK